MRYAEVLLTYAEAKIEFNQIDESVFNAINEVRQRLNVNMPHVKGTKFQVEMQTIVRHERVVELAFEGQRYFAIDHWRIVEQVINKPLDGMTYTGINGNFITIKDATVRQFDLKWDYL